MFDEQLMIDAKNDLIRLMNENEYDNEMIEKLSNDENVINWILHCVFTNNDEYESVDDLFNDAGFVEFLQLQYENPITYDEMIKI